MSPTPHTARLPCRASLTIALATGSASAAVTAPHVVAALANSSSLEISNYAPGAPITAEVVRNGSVVGSATGQVDASSDPKANGTFNVNPTACWTGFTPIILPGDVIRVTSLGVVDETQVKDVSVDSFEVIPDVGSSTLKIHGTAADPVTHAPLPLTEIESRVIATTGFFNKNLRKRIQTGHVGAAGEGTMAFDGPGDIHWTATYPGLDAHDIALATDSTTQLRGLWATAAADEVTIMIHGAVAAAAAPCTQPVANNAVTGTTPNTINAANVGVADLVVTGIAFSADHVDLKISDANAVPLITVATTLTPGPGQQTWTATIPAATVQGFPDGPLKLSGTYYATPDPLDPGLAGSDLTVSKDVVAPDAPNATPGSGTYSETQAVLLQHTDGSGSRIVFRTDGSDPTTSSTIANGQVFVTNSLTLKAMVIDRAGNTSPVASFAYSIVRPPPPPFAPPLVFGPPIVLTPASSGAPAPGPTAPAISLVRAKCVPVGSAKSKVRKKCQPGVSFSLSIAARVTFVVRNAKGKVIGSFVRSGPAGANTVVLPAKLGGRVIKPGRYTFALTASAGGLTSTTKTSTSVTLPKP